ncbi:MAG TPA: VOC family protein [Candidatus Acidoferrales bacterium]|nr:VOC family protein [Candidatus Acidoferrales bacterium]
MPQIRHIAISSDDTERLAEFYKEVFGFWESRRAPEGRKTIYLTDGHVELAILENTNQQNSNGLHHFGIQTDDLDATVQHIEKLQSAKAVYKAEIGSMTQTWLSDPSGNHIYLSADGKLEYQPVEKYAYRKKK